MAATMAEKPGAGKTWPSSAISASPEPMPISAVAIGSPIASSEPNAISSTDRRRAHADPVRGAAVRRLGLVNHVAARPAPLSAGRGGGTAAVRSTSISSFTAGGSGGSPYRTANT